MRYDKAERSPSSTATEAFLTSLVMPVATEYTTTENTTATSAIKVTSPSRLCSSLRLSCHTFLNQRPMPSPRKCACGVVLC